MQSTDRVVSVLVVDDEPEIVDLISYHLALAGYEVLSASSGREALDVAQATLPALVILDILLPDMSGLEVLSELRSPQFPATIPCLLLSALRDDVDRIRGLTFGADDYLTKPFNPDELVLRVKAILRRAAAPRAPDDMLSLGPVTIDRRGRRVLVGDTDIGLTPTEYRLFVLMADNPGLAHRRDQLLHVMWGGDSETHTRTVDVHVQRLRAKLGRSGEMVQTVRGFGYRLSPEDAAPP